MSDGFYESTRTNQAWPHLRISRYQQRISEIFLSLISVKSFASSRVRTADLESHSPLLYHRAKLNCCKVKLLKTINKLSLNSQGSQGPEFFSKFLRWVPPELNSVSRQVNCYRTKIGGKCQNWKFQNETFWVIFKQCDLFLMTSFNYFLSLVG